MALLVLSQKCSFLFSLAMLLSTFFLHNSASAAATLPANGTAPAVFTFGDSTVDTGNNDYIISGVKSNFPPYGRDFVAGMPTGRFSNGRVPSDLIAEGFGVKKILPAYLDPSLKFQELLTGVCFASAGSGYDPLTAELQAVMSLSVQLDLFKEYISKINAAVGKERTAILLSKSFFLISMGSNDIAVNYFATPLRRAHYDLPAYTDFLLELSSNFVKELYAHGARLIGVANLPPIGCVPIMRTLAGGNESACYEAANQAAMLFNSKLSSKIESLNKQHPKALVFHVDIYNPLMSIIQDPSHYGFEEVDKGCCGTGTVEYGLLCNKDTPGTCDDVSKYMFWDAFHPTEAAYRILTTEIFKQLEFFYELCEENHEAYVQPS